MAEPRVARKITTPRFPSDWTPELVEAFEEVFAALNGNEEGKDRLFEMETGIADAATKLSQFTAQLDASGNVTVSVLTDFNAALSSINALTPAADNLPYYTNATTAALATVTSQGRALLDDTSFADMATTLGLGTLDDPTFDNVTVTTLSVGANQVVGAQAAAVADANAISAITNYGGQTVSAGYVQAEAQQTDDAVNTLEDEVTTLASEAEDIKDQLNDLLAKLRTHGLIAT